ncbi:MAG: 4-(cytidine 5'-diphospho)-2-C-methyl-D-erythritol kinase [Pseudomonadota bacterium]
MAAETGSVVERAPAKVNLYLHLCGQRADGYHLLDSLVVFPEVGDVVTASRTDVLDLSISGPFSGTLSTCADNLVLRAARGIAGAQSSGQGASLHLEKHLPVASGIGGGSSDAAAALRALCRLWECDLPDDLALSLGADVPVCLQAPTPVRMRGIGERLFPAPAFPAMAIVLVNPQVEVATGAVFAGVEDRDPPPGPQAPVDGFQEFDGFIAWLALQRNDLQASAEAICPEIGNTLSALSTAPLARMSGSGATCFGLFPDFRVAERAADDIRRARPDWWVAAAQVPTT